MDRIPPTSGWALAIDSRGNLLRRLINGTCCCLASFGSEKSTCCNPCGWEEHRNKTVKTLESLDVGCPSASESESWSRTIYIYIICIRKYCIYTSNISFLIIRYSFPKHHLLHRRGRQVKVILPSLLVSRSCASLLCCFGQRGAPWHAEILGAAAASSASAAGLHEPTYNVYIYMSTYMLHVYCIHMYILMDLISSNRPRSCGWWVGSRASMRCWILCNLYTVQRCFVVVYYLWTCYAPQDLRWAKHAKRSYIWSFCQVQWWRCTYLDEMGLLSLFTISSLSCTSSASGLRKDGDMWYGSGFRISLVFDYTNEVQK